MRPPKSSEVPTARVIVGKPGAKVLVGPRVVDTSNGPRFGRHDTRLLHSSRDAGQAFDTWEGRETPMSLHLVVWDRPEISAAATTRVAAPGNGLG